MAMPGDGFVTLKITIAPYDISNNKMVCRLAWNYIDVDTASLVSKTGKTNTHTIECKLDATVTPINIYVKSDGFRDVFIPFKGSCDADSAGDISITIPVQMVLVEDDVVIQPNGAVVVIQDEQESDSMVSEITSFR